MTPLFTVKPVENTRASSLPTKAANSFSNCTWMSSVPLRKREPAQPEPYFLRASMPALMTRSSPVSPV